MPCNQCTWHDRELRCIYLREPKSARPAWSRKLKQLQKVVQQLFPDSDLNILEELPKLELLKLLDPRDSSLLLTDSPQSSPEPTQSEPENKQASGASADLEALELEPNTQAKWDESRVGPEGFPVFPDDVNALSFNANLRSSYVGVSSIAAALRVVAKLDKTTERLTVQGSPLPQVIHGDYVDLPLHTHIDGATHSVLAQTLNEAEIVDAYFWHVHPQVPFLDEAQFKIRLFTGARTDLSWVALLNMVFALGTAAGSNWKDQSHLRLYERASQAIQADGFNNGSIEMVQALILMGGLYLHYTSRPNKANAIIGAAIRMACALGLHRERNSNRSEHSFASDKSTLVPQEIRRRTWWCLFCVDTWGSMYSGRPSLGRISPAVTVNLPGHIGPSSYSAFNPTMTSEDNVLATALRHEVTLCKIATRLCDRLAETPLLSREEVNDFDAELQAWYSNLPSILCFPETCPERVVVLRDIMGWQHRNLRLVLHRPSLLNNALRMCYSKANKSYATEVDSIMICRVVAREAIDDIKARWQPTNISGGTANWFLYQTSMIPLITVFTECKRQNLKGACEAQAQLEEILLFFDELSLWTFTGEPVHTLMTRFTKHCRDMINKAVDPVTQDRQEYNQASPLNADGMDIADGTESEFAQGDQESASSIEEYDTGGQGPYCDFMVETERDMFLNGLIWGELGC